MADKWVQLKGANGDRLFPATKMDLLWTNASPASSFAAQTIELNLSGYSYIYLLYYVTSNELGVPVKSSIPSLGKFCMNFVTGDTGYRRLRAFSVTTTGLIFEAGTNNGSTNNTLMIPYKIYGIK